jgi:hypothetical protein
MTMYRTNPSSGPSVPMPPPPNRLRPLWIAVFAVGVHAAVLGAAFAARAPEAVGPRTKIVSVLTGQVDAWTGDFHANGVQRARIRD